MVGARRARGGATRSSTRPGLRPHCRRHARSRRLPGPAAVDDDRRVVGFGSGGAHLPQPAWFANYAIDGAIHEADSTLDIYRRAIALRRQLNAGDGLTWIPTGCDDVLAFRRTDGWVCVTNFAFTPYDHSFGTVAISSSPMEGDALPPATAAWVTPTR